MTTLRSAAPVPVVVLRSSGHAGSRWLAELLATQSNISFLFEFPGHCSERKYPQTANASLQDIFGTACACRLDSAMASVCEPDEAGRIRSMGCVKHAFCAGRCPRRGDTTCSAVGFIDSYQPALARRVALARAGGVPIALVTFERDNAAKHALSKLRASCGGTSLKGNHLKAAEAAAGNGGGAAAWGGAVDAAAPPPPPALLHVAPALFRAEALQSLHGRRRMREGVGRAFGGPVYRLHYEELQADARGTLRKLLEAAGVRTFDESALRKSALRKGSSEDLRGTLLNFEDLHAHLANLPCMQSMLAAPRPQRFDDSCGAGGIDSGARHQAKQDVAARVLRCSTDSQRAPVACTLMRMNRLATAAVADAAHAASARTRQKQRRLGVFTLQRQPAAKGHEHIANGSYTSAMAALVAGKCTDEEHSMCARVLRSVGSERSAGDTTTPAEADVCVLRATDDPVGLRSLR